MEHEHITIDHLQWAFANGALITAGTCGFGRDCVGLQVSDHWVDYDSWTPDNPDAPSWEGFIPEDAYHKHPCVAVLGQDDNAWEQLAEWLSAIMAEGWVACVLVTTHRRPTSLRRCCTVR